MEKPREFYIAQGSHADIVCYTEKEAQDLEWAKPYLHVIEYKAYKKLKEENESLKEAISYLPKVPMEPFEKMISKENIELKAKLEIAIEALEKIAKSDKYLWTITPQNLMDSALGNIAREALERVK